MFELVFIACLIKQPDRCEERSLQFVDMPGVMACMATAQPQLAAWTEQHPRWQVTGWSCRTLGQREREA